MEVAFTFLQKAWGSLPFELIIVCGLLAALFYVIAYFKEEKKKLEKRIEIRDAQHEEMVKILMSSSSIISELTNTMKAQISSVQNSMDKLGSLIVTKADDTKNHLSMAILSIRKGGN